MKYTFDLDYKKMWESATDKALILQEENKVLKESSEHNDKVVDKVNWENMLLKKENKQLKECYCNRTDCSGRIKNSRKYDSLYQKHNKQLDNWIKLREYINKMHEYFLYTDVNEIYKQSMKEDNSFPNLFNLSELNASDRILSSICKKIQELEQGSDNNECNTIQ